MEQTTYCSTAAHPASDDKKCDKTTDEQPDYYDDHADELQNRHYYIQTSEAVLPV